MIFTIAHRLLSLAKGQRLSIFIFHRVLSAHDPMMPGEPTVEEFDAMVGWIKKDFRIFPLGEALHRFSQDASGTPLAVITFDDGYADNFHNAFPVLKKHGVAATFFIATGYLDGGRMWNDTIIESIRRAPNAELDLTPIGFDRYRLIDEADRLHCISDLIDRCKYLESARRIEISDEVSNFCRTKLPVDLMLTAIELREMSNFGMEIGAHTISHPILAHLSDADARTEISVGRETLRAIVGSSIEYFAYPNGKSARDYWSRDVEIVRQAGFKAAVSTDWGVVTNRSDLFELPRFTPWDRTQALFRARVVYNSFNAEKCYGR